ncbi:hypothetical protein Tco_0211038 [Tanacetum coccineum]
MPRFSSNDMVHNYYLEEARKKTQERNRDSITSVMRTASPQNTTKGSKPKPRSNNQTSKSLLVSKSSCVMIMVVLKADHSNNSTSFSDSKHFIQSNKTRNSNKPVEQKSHTQKPVRQISTGHRFSPNKTSAVYEKTSSRSDLRWKPMGRIFKSVGLGWIPTGNLFDSCTSKADSEPIHGSNVDISKIHEYKQTLDLSASTSINVQKEQKTSVEVDSKLIRRMTFEHNGSSLTPQCQKSSYNRYDKHDVDDRVGKSIRFFVRRIFQWSKSSCFKVFAVTAADASDKRQQQPDLTSSTSTLKTTVTADEKFDVYIFLFFSLF